MKTTSRKLRNKPTANITKAHYAAAARQAEVFKDALSGDAGYEDPSVNLVALEGMIQGWIIAQPWFDKWRKDLESAFSRENVYLHVQDWALQIASDTSKGHYRFDVEEQILGRPWRVPASNTIRILDRKIDRAKQTLGINLSIG